MVNSFNALIEKLDLLSLCWERNEIGSNRVSFMERSHKILADLLHQLTSSRQFIKLSFFSTYFQGAGKEIREAISDPSPDVQERAWHVVLPLVEKLKACYVHSLELERIVPKLLSQLVGGRLNPTQHLETQQALVKQLAEILEFVLKFDEYKVGFNCLSPNSLLIFSGFIYFSRWKRPQYRTTSVTIDALWVVSGWITIIRCSSARNWQTACRCFTPTLRPCWRFSARRRQSLCKIMRTTSITRQKQLERWRKFVWGCWRKSEIGRRSKGLNCCLKYCVISGSSCRKLNARKRICSSFG